MIYVIYNQLLKLDGRKMHHVKVQKSQQKRE